MHFVQTQTDYRVPEIGLVPTRMTGGAVIIQPADPLASGVAGSAVQLGMVLIQGPAGHGMGKSGLFLGAVALVTGVGSVTVVADGVNFFHGLFYFNRFLQVVAIAAAFTLMTIGAA